MDLSGKWLFQEDFETGINSGIATIHQDDDKISGKLELTEKLMDESPIQLEQTIEGLIMGKKVIFKGQEFRLVNGPDECEYALDSWEGTINSEGQIIGSSIDQHGICGVFTMKRVEE